MSLRAGELPGNTPVVAEVACQRRIKPATGCTGVLRKRFDSSYPSHFKQQNKSMEKSESIKEIALALSKFQAQIPKIDLDREVEVQTKTGGKYKFKYATFANILEKIRKPLSENGLSFSQLVNVDGSVTTILMHSSGEWLSSSLTITGDKTPQGIGSAITYNKRYSLTSILGICGDDDDDGNGAQGNSFKFREKSPVPQNKDTGQKQEKKITFTQDKVNDKLLKRLHEIEAEAKTKGERFSLFSFLESIYTITPDDVKFVCARLGEYEKQNNLTPAQ